MGSPGGGGHIFTGIYRDFFFPKYSKINLLQKAVTLVEGTSDSVDLNLNLKSKSLGVGLGHIRYPIVQRKILYFNYLQKLYCYYV